MKLILQKELGIIAYDEDEWDNVTYTERQTIGVLYGYSDINKYNIKAFFQAYEYYYQVQSLSEQSEDFKNCCRAFYLPIQYISPDGMVSEIEGYPSQVVNLPINLNVDFVEIREDDPIHPNHYKQGEVECIDVIEQWPLCIGTAVKYMWRYLDKENSIQDLNKAIWYLERQIKLMDKIKVNYIQYAGYDSMILPIDHIQSKHIKKAMQLIWGPKTLVCFIAGAIVNIKDEIKELEKEERV